MGNKYPPDGVAEYIMVMGLNYSGNGATTGREEKIFNTYSHLVDEEEAKKMTTSFVAELEARGEARGKAEGLIEGVLAFLEARFGKVPLPAKRAVITCTDLARLDALARLAATCESMEEFSKGLPQV